MLRMTLLFFWFSQERGVYCFRVLFWRQTKASKFSTSQKWPPKDRSVHWLMGNAYGLLTKREVKMAGYWPSSFLRVYGPRRSRGP